MIRFVVKSALALGLLALVVPLGGGSGANGTSLDLFGVANGVREAAADLGGFCTRAPAACEAGRDVAAFAGERIEAGLRIGYDYLDERIVAPRAAPSEAVAMEDARPDPVTTGAVETPAGPRPYMPPRPVLAEAGTGRAEAHAMRQAVAIPTPAPRG